MDTTLDRLLDTYEVARFLGLSSTTVASADWRQRVGLRAIKIGGAIRYLESDVVALLDRGRETFNRAQSRQAMRCDDGDDRTRHRSAANL